VAIVNQYIRRQKQEIEDRSRRIEGYIATMTEDDLNEALDVVLVSSFLVILIWGY
jgi:hypothetical protein